MEPAHMVEELVCRVRTGDVEGVKSILDHTTFTCASLDSILLPTDDPDCPGASLMVLAAGKGYTDIVRVLQRAGLAADARGHFLYTPLQAAAHRGHHRVMEALLPGQPNLDAGDQYGVTALHLAARRGWVSCARVLVKAGANLDARDTAMRTPLHHAIVSHSTPVLKLLLDSGCDSTALESTSFTPMHIAGMMGNEEAIQELSTSGQSMEVTDNTGMTPEEMAQAWGRHNTAWLLHKMTSTTLRKPTPSHFLLRRSWKDYESEGNKTINWVREENTFFLEANVPENRDGYYQDQNGWTALHWAAHLGLDNTVRTLAGPCGIFLNVVTYASQTPADLAQMSGHQLLSQWLRSSCESEEVEDEAVLYRKLLLVISGGDDVKAASRLLHQGASLLPVADLHSTALVLAITCNRPRIVSLLVAAGAPITTRIGGLSLLQVAWTSPDVTIRVKAQITRHYLHMLEAERQQVGPPDGDLHRGIQWMIKELRGDHPRCVSWPLEQHTSLTDLMTAAAIYYCPVTAAFLRQAGAKAFLQDATGRTPLHAALDNRHWDMARVLVRDLGACLYVPDSLGRIPLDLLPKCMRREEEMSLYYRERRQLEDIQQGMKDKEDQQRVLEVTDIYDYLFNLYKSGEVKPEISPPHSETLLYALMLAAQRGLLHLTYLLVVVGGLEGAHVVVDATHDSCPLHQAASHGNLGCVTLLLALGAPTHQQDRYGHTAGHLAAMFGHKATFEQLQGVDWEYEPRCRAGTTHSEINHNFRDYLRIFGKQTVDLEQHTLCNKPSKGIQAIFRSLDLKTFLAELSKITVDFKQNEDKEVKDIILKEIQIIVNKVSKLNGFYKGELVIVGSTSDGTRLYAPDEYDINLVLSDIPGVSVEVEEQEKTRVALTGHSCQVQVVSSHPNLQGNVLIKEFSRLVQSCLRTHTTSDSRLSLVPPGVTMTQMGVALAFAWQGCKYPLLLIGVDLVPVLSVPWPPRVFRPLLTPPNITQVYLSNVGEGDWRCSFAKAEADVLSGLTKEERQVYLVLKALLSTLKAEPWMPREVKDNFTWWDSRRWKIMVPAGFAMKNAFLKRLEQKRYEKQLDWKRYQKQEDWKQDNHLVCKCTNKKLVCKPDNEQLNCKKDIDQSDWKQDHGCLDWTAMKQAVIGLLRDMCMSFQDPETGLESLVPAKIYAYFGGEFERPKIGEGAPEIIKILEEDW
ncbi:hypothetical protein Pcinc_011149 [Petrolisthes cinctipes]|uniref:Uncharacterized protein n=1 Tax=Petrolisthes cinctipes TaxID=88211 RepID=A0AAE1G1D9_PETCI|nr:hypothetical protein Pcinc_011149 [Petrolisthes cinctipes]